MNTAAFLKHSNEGTRSLFIARMFLGLLEIRNLLELGNADPRNKQIARKQFDKLHNPLFMAIQATRDAAVEIIETVSNHKEALATGQIVTIQVSGTAVVNVTPDRGLIQLGVQSNATSPQKVELVNSATNSRVIQALKAQGIEEKDIVTDWYVIEPIYDDYDSLYIKGYHINNIVVITLRDISKVNKVIIAALNAGANQVVNVEFYLSNLRKYRDQAREMAMIAAQEKAQDLASAAGAETGCVMNINENSWSYYNGGWYSQNRDLWTQNTM